METDSAHTLIHSLSKRLFSAYSVYHAQLPVGNATPQPGEWTEQTGHCIRPGNSWALSPPLSAPLRLTLDQAFLVGYLTPGLLFLD